jgi:hypothetical protein
MADLEGIFVSCLKSNFDLYEQIEGGSFVRWDKENKKLMKSKQLITKKGVYLPINNKAIKVKAIKLPSTATEYKGTLILLKEIEEHINKYVDISDHFRKLSSWYIAMTWIFDNLNTINYLRVLADWGQGKTRYLNVVGDLCYKPIPIAGAINQAQLFRLMDIWKGTLLLDETVLDKSDESSSIVQILNSGIERNKYVWRCDQENFKEVEPYNPFGPKIIASRQPFKDQALESRCITERIKQTNRDNIPVELPPSFYSEQQELRNKLLMFRLRNWNVPNSENIKNIQFPECNRRMQQMMAPFAVTFYEFKEVIKDLNSFITVYYTNRQIEISTSLDGGIVNAIWYLYTIGVKQITSNLILIAMKKLGFTIGRTTEVTIGRRRKNLGIEATQKTIANKSQMSIDWDQKLMESLAEKYLTKERREHYKKELEKRDNLNKNQPNSEPVIW